MTRASENPYPHVTGVEQASAPATPASGRRLIYPKSDGWYDLDDAGVETQLGSGASIEYVRKPADESVSNSTSLQADDDLFVPIGADEVWLVQFILTTLADSLTPDIQVAVAAPTGAAGWWSADAGADAGSSANKGDQIVTAASLGVALTYAAFGGYSHLHLVARVFNGANAGNVALQWAQATADAASTSVLADSLLIAERLA